MIGMGPYLFAPPPQWKEEDAKSLNARRSRGASEFKKKKKRLKMSKASRRKNLN